MCKCLHIKWDIKAVDYIYSNDYSLLSFYKLTALIILLKCL